MRVEQGLCSVELWKMLREVESLDNNILIEEILHIKYERSLETKEIVSNFMKTGRLSEKDREKLVAHYILHWLEDVQ